MLIFRKNSDQSSFIPQSCMRFFKYLISRKNLLGRHLSLKFRHFKTRTVDLISRKNKTVIQPESHCAFYFAVGFTKSESHNNGHIC